MGNALCIEVGAAGPILLTGTANDEVENVHISFVQYKRLFDLVKRLLH